MQTRHDAQRELSDSQKRAEAAINSFIEQLSLTIQATQTQQQADLAEGRTPRPLDCFGTFGTLGTAGGCFGSFGTYGCHSKVGQ